jgi:hypothetical protein
MSYALVINGNIRSEGRLPDSAKLVLPGDTTAATGATRSGLRTYGTVAEREACGWFEVVDVVPPADTPTQTSTRSLTMVNGKPTVTWTIRPKTVEEQAADTAAANRSSIDLFLSDAKATCDTITGRAAFSLTQADLRQCQQDTKDLARIAKRLIRKELGQLDVSS